MDMTASWHKKTMELVRKHSLGCLHNPGGGQFTNRAKGINIQVPDDDDMGVYITLLRGLQKIGVEADFPRPNDNIVV